MPYVIRKEVVARSLKRLREQKTHALFAGYLHLQQRTSELERLNDLQPDFASYFKLFFRVDHHPLGAPYIKPFTEQKASTQNLWLNSNIAGSYAPSSIRPEKPFGKVVRVEGKIYNLPLDHAEKAFEYLLYSSKVQVAHLAVFLYRDFALRGPNSSPPTISNLIDIFSFEFGYSDVSIGGYDSDFATLYDLPDEAEWQNDWLIDASE